MRVGRWDNMLGLAKQCRSCGAWSGPRWTVKRLGIVIAASIFANILVLFFITRPLRALCLTIVYVASVAGLFAAADAMHNEALVMTAMIAIVMGPACLAAIEFLWHDVELARGPRIGKRKPPPRPRVVLEMEQFRNELEIAIHHSKERIAFLANATYFVAALDAVLVALDSRWIELTVPLILAGLAYSIRAHECRAWAIAFTAFGAGHAVWYIVLRIERATEPPSWLLLLGIIALGIAMIEATIRLARLRRIRAQVPLGPAAHLQD